MASRRAQRMNQTRGTSDAASQERGGREIPRVRKQAIALGVMVAVTTFLNIVLYRLVEREVFYRPRVQSCAGLQDQAGDDQGSSQNPPLSLLKTSLCLRTALVTLDADTAHRGLTLSEDGRRVGWTDRPQSRPDKPKRFIGFPCVLGWEEFTSGRHYWEVQLLQEVGGWRVGVAGESVRREGTMDDSPEGGIWAVWRWGDYGQYVALYSPPTPLIPHQTPLKLGLYLDYGGGRLSVYNADTWEHLHTFNDSFTGWLRPYFWVNAGSDLRLV
ncbi:E3 ubiquitin-protein ligase TRIM58-like [Pleurodeles waltl]|uniref:E3 ubiquitin-protein ligase TRIM58-like n=1 Tax=Pleurodeles waltl TaxID=8319 RepID=UPI0037093A3C